MKTLKKMLAGLVPGALMSLVPALATAGDMTVGEEVPSLVGTWEYVMTVRADAADCTFSRVSFKICRRRARSIFRARLMAARYS